MRLLQPWVRRRHRRRGRAEPGYLQHMEQRFGHYPGLAPSSGWVWIHAVSLGETRAAALLLAALREQVPGLRLLLTHGTATGRAEGAKLLRPGDLQVWQPWDTPAAVQRFLLHFRPVLGVLLETEVWPHWVQGCRAHGVPLLLANARLNLKSFRGAQRLRCLMRPAYAGLSAVLAQTEADAARLRAIGVHAVQVLGNLKFDLTPDPEQIERGRRWRAALGGRRVLMLASSREGEEALWLQALRQAQDSPFGPEAPLWLLVPRHPQRFDAVAALLQQAGLSVFRRSQWPEGLDAADAARSAQVWLGDSLGEMHAYYAMADLAWLGGSFLPLGGQNLIEAAACGCPVLMGPHTYNFHDAAEQALHCGAARRVPDMAAALPATRHWLEDAAALQRARQGCAALLQQGQGAAQRSAALLRAAMAPSTP
ncbi:MAG: 3-deoxy-D-manno-octulosonic acid transferase [Comamonadaceae bacterium BICA1-1]|nr:MAG: 3-deoxy-D-manno-octulosonic acid transferase [Comamonadaceae bacterium BICA1-1]